MDSLNLENSSFLPQPFIEPCTFIQGVCSLVSDTEEPRRTSWGQLSLNIRVCRGDLRSILKGLEFSPAFEDFWNVTVAVSFFTFFVKKVGTEAKGTGKSLHMESWCISGGKGWPMNSFKIERKYWEYPVNKVNLLIHLLFFKLIWDWCIETI